MSLTEGARRAAQHLTDHAYVRVLAGVTPDGVAAAALLSHALHREGVDFHLSFLDEIDPDTAAAVSAEKNELTVLVDCPVTVPRETAHGLGSQLLRIDRHRLEPGEENVLDVTAESAGADGSTECTAATLAYAVAVNLNHHNRGLLPVALAAARLDGQHVEGWRGLNAEFLAEALEEGAVREARRLHLDGVNLIEALSQGVDPYFPGFAGRARLAMGWLADHDLPAEEALHAFSAPVTTRAGSALALRLLETGTPGPGVEAAFAPVHGATEGPVRDVPVPRLARLVQASLFAGEPEAPAVAFTRGALPDDEAAKSRAFREHLLQVLLRAERDDAPGRFHVLEAPTRSLAEPLAQATALTVGLARAKGVVAVHRGEHRDCIAVRWVRRRDARDEPRNLAKTVEAAGEGATGRAHPAGGVLLLPAGGAERVLTLLGTGGRAP